MQEFSHIFPLLLPACLPEGPCSAHKVWAWDLFHPTLLPCPAGSEAARSSLERDLVFESFSGSDFKGLDTRRHFVWFDDQEELVVRGMDFAF